MSFLTTINCRTLCAAFAALLVASMTVACDRQAAATAAVEPGATVLPATPALPAKPSLPAKPALPPAPAEPAAAEGVLTLAVGEEAEIAARTTLRFDHVVSDSRCPAGAQCIWAGEVRIALVLATPNESTPFELSSERDNKITVQSFDIEFVAYAACPVDKGGNALGRECASLKVAANAAQ